jgi:hypothetical protein
MTTSLCLEDGSPVVLKKDMITLPYRKREVIEMLKSLKPSEIYHSTTGCCLR